MTNQNCGRCGRRFYQPDPFGGNLCPQCKNSVRYDSRGGGGGSTFDALVRKIAPWILIPILIGALIMRFKVYIISIAVIVTVCLILCRYIYPKTRNSDRKTGITIGLSIILIISVFFIVPKIENGSPRTTPVTRNQTVPSQASYMLVNANALNVRKGPSTDYDVVGQLTKGTRVQILDNSGQWWKIKIGNIEGYVHSDYLINEGSTSSTSYSEPGAEKTSSLPASPSKPVLKTTQDAEFQQAWRDGHAYMDSLPEAPPNLLLPNGKTVAEHIRDGAPPDK